MKKSDFKNQILEILSNHKLGNKKGLIEDIENIFKSSNRNLEFIPNDENGNIWDRKFRIFLSEDNFSKSMISHIEKVQKNGHSIQSELIFKINLELKNSLKDEIKENLDLLLEDKISSDDFKNLKSKNEMKISKLENFQKGIWDLKLLDFSEDEIREYLKNIIS